MLFRKSLLVPSNQWNAEGMVDMFLSEKLAHDYFKRLGFKVFKLEPKKKLDEIILKDLGFLKSIENFVSGGIPDFLCWNNKIFFFVECKSGKSTLNEIQSKWIDTFQDRFDILVIRIKPDDHDYISAADPSLSGYSHIRDEYTSAIETFSSIRCGRKISKEEQASELSQEEDLILYPKEKVSKSEELAYYHLVAMDYASLKLNKYYLEIGKILDKKNTETNKYKIAYEKLRDGVDNYSLNLNYHKVKALKHLEDIIPPEKAESIRSRRTQETASLTGIYIEQQEEKNPVTFKTAKELLDESKESGDSVS